jgi:hypothetical protein
MDVGQQVDGHTRRVLDLRVSVQSVLDEDLKHQTRAPADEEQHDDQDQHFDHLRSLENINTPFIDRIASLSSR